MNLSCQLSYFNLMSSTMSRVNPSSSGFLSRSQSIWAVSPILNMLTFDWEFGRFSKRLRSITGVECSWDSPSYEDQCIWMTRFQVYTETCLNWYCCIAINYAMTHLILLVGLDIRWSLIYHYSLFRLFRLSADELLITFTKVVLILVMMYN